MGPRIAWKKLLILAPALLLAVALWSPILAQEREPETPSPGVEVAAELATGRTQAQWGEEVPLALIVVNRSPFTLTRPALQPLGVDLIWWQEPILLGDIPPYSVVHRYPITCTVSGPHPRPLAALEYAWTDDTGIQRRTELPIQGTAIELITWLPFWLTLHPWTPDLVITAGTVFFALLSILLSSWLVEKRRHKRDQGRALGILEMMATEALHGARYGLEVNTEALRDLFMEEGLYEAMARLDRQRGVRKDEKRGAQDEETTEDATADSKRQEEKEKGLVAAALQLWRTARQHNVGLERPGGTRRMRELEKAAQELDEQVEQTRKFLRSSCLHKLRSRFPRRST